MESDADRRLDAVADVALITLDRGGLVTGWHPGSKHVSGWSENSIMGCHLSVLFPLGGAEANWPERMLAIACDTGRYEEQGLYLGAGVRHSTPTFWLFHRATRTGGSWDIPWRCGR